MIKKSNTSTKATMCKASQIVYDWCDRTFPNAYWSHSTWIWGLHRVQVNDLIIDFRIDKALSPTVAAHEIIETIKETVSDYEESDYQWDYARNFFFKVASNS